MTPERWPRVKEVLQEALNRDAELRAAYLDQACGPDAELRRSVEELLASDQRMGEFLLAPLAGLTTAAAVLDADEPVCGQLAGPYRLLHEIGRGGMGAVYLGERADGQFRKHVAVKLIHAHLGGEDVMRRFRNERQVLASLEHPNIARLIDGGVMGDGSLYLVMEYVEGVRIDEWCDSRKLPAPDRLKLFRQVCDAVQSAHDRQIIHRDIKPANILVNAQGTPKLLDFGIAKALDTPAFTRYPETTVGHGPMTPEYASPEQARGDGAGIATDIYALGVVLYQLLTGRLPYSVRADDVRAISDQAVLKPSAAIADASSEVCERRSESPAALRRRLAGDLGDVLLRALHKEPDQRYASAAAFSDDLLRVLTDRPVRAHKAGVLYRGQKFIRRNWALVTAGVAGALLLLALIVVGKPFRSGASSSRAIAVLPLENLSPDREQDYLADGITDALINDLARIRGLHVISRTSVMSYKGPRRLPEVARNLGVQTVVEGSVLRTGSHVNIAIRLMDAVQDRALWSGSYEGELQDAPALQSKVTEAIASEIHVTLSAPDQPSRSGRVNLGAYEAYLKGRNQYVTEFSEESMQKAIASFHRALTFDLSYAPAYAGLADCYYMLSSIYFPPAEVMPKAKAAAVKAIELDDRLAEAHATLALVRSLYEFNRADAEQGFQRALELKPSDAQTHLWYGLHLAGMSRFDPALREVELAQKLDPVSPAMNAYIGTVLYFARRYDELIQRMRPIAEIYPNYHQPRAFLALAYEQKGDWNRAIAEMEKAVQLDRDQDGMAQLGHIYAMSGRTADARKLLRELKELSQKRYVSAYNIGVLHLGLGEREEAFRWLQQLEEDRSEWFAMINVDPRLDTLHSDPRFRSLLRSVGLAP